MSNIFGYFRVPPALWKTANEIVLIVDSNSYCICCRSRPDLFVHLEATEEEKDEEGCHRRINHSPENGQEGKTEQSDTACQKDEPTVICEPRYRYSYSANLILPWAIGPGFYRSMFELS